MSITFFCLLIALSSEQLACLVGIDGNGIALTCASLSLPIAALSSIQTALFQRNLDFKSLFKVRLGTALIPLIVTLPLAIIGFGFWSLIFGTLLGKIFSAAALTVFSPWKPNHFFSFDYLKKMFHFSVWTLLESFSIWLTSWIGIFVIGSMLSSPYVGLYNNSTATVNSVIAIIASSTSSVLISTLSRLQNNRSQFESCFLKYQETVSFFVFPIGGLFLSFSSLITTVLLGPNWKEASLLIGLWGFSSSLVIPYANYGSIAYVALGRPKVSFVVQMLYLALLVPALILASQNGFFMLSIVAPSMRIVFVVIHLITLKTVVHMPVAEMLKHSAKYFATSLLICISVCIARIIFGQSLIMNLLLGLVFVAVYIAVFRNNVILRQLKDKIVR